MLFALVWVLNFAISVWNAYAVGKVWIEARVAGGWHQFMCWIGAIMSACGFTWCYLSFLALTAHYFQLLTEEQVLAALNLGYVLLLPFILFGGYAITFDSWAQAFRRGGILNYGAAAWNTYASFHNTYSAWRNLSGAFASLGNFFGGSRRGESDRNGEGGRGIIIVLLLVVFALLAGVLTTAAIIRRVAATEPLPPPPVENKDGKALTVR
jgi:hypothetical protein